MNNKIFLEDVSYGIYDRPAPDKQSGDISTVPDDVPVNPSEQIPGQLTVERPPIEDDKFVPGSIEELSRSATAISRLVPSSQIDFFYSAMHKLLDQSMDRSQLPNEDIDNKDDKVKKANIVSADTLGPSINTESKIRNAVKNSLVEMLSGDDMDDLDSYRGRQKYDTSGVDYFGEESLDDNKKQDDKDSYSLDDIASEMGYSGASGVRQEIQRLLGRLQYFVVNVKPEDLEGLKDFATKEYIESLGNTGLLDDEDIEELRAAPAAVKSLGSFKWFFVLQFIMPAYREVVRNATRGLNDGIDSLGVPGYMKQSIFNQVTGLSKRGTIAKKLASVVKSGDLTKEEALQIVKKIEPAMANLESLSKKTGDLIQLSLDKWGTLGKKRKAAAVEKAMKATM
jgi:hypothetical protein